MSVFTVVIIIGVIYQLVTAVTKKQGTQRTPGKSADPFKLPDGRFIGDAIQGIHGTWREQLKQALENASNQAGPLQPTNPKDFEEITDYYVETEGTEGTEEIDRTQGIQGIEGTSDYVGIPRLEAYKRIVEAPRKEMAMNSSGLNGGSLSLTERELVQGVMWSVILGKPRAMHQFRGPRT